MAEQLGDPREWLREKLGEADYADFEKGMRGAAKDAAEGKPAGQPAEVEGQAPCTAHCWSNCGASFAVQSGYWNWWFVRM